ncbi:Uroporphyrinogen-III synthase [Bathymodiolus heckerae thiotrophic gill symbiont]|uniref:uroporphyrinogen-III synthase n=1 Tax=Bathymodiolus heckerae thiotrophic gill symbiont TaxID=1052212 RepID=UPI0010B84337|nr:uroporphyrinogen-III synthase [Bathymodiolus heckerae thiotrophic gill symbiont]SHN90145.1 Uroporphyrinogen-III synthase [Bathymodiolus heckerae thiotrophic gill symbiont]
MNVLLIRPLAQVQTLEALVADSGYKPLLFPTLKIKSISAKLKHSQYDVVIFISVNAVEHGLVLLDQIHPAKIFTVGAATAQKLNDYGISVDDFPKEKPSSEALLALNSVSQLRHKKVLIFRGKGGRETLKNGLEKNHNQVEYIEVYDRVVCTLTPDHKTSLNIFLSNNQGVISITSNENLDGLISLATQLNQLDKLKTYLLVVLSQRIEKYALSLGFTQTLITVDISDQAIVTVLEDIDTLDK